MKNDRSKGRNSRLIRRQYFNSPMLIWLSIFWLALETSIFDQLFGSDIDCSEWIREIYELAFTVFTVTVPFIVLSVFNRTSFGKIICFIDDKGIHYKGRLITWDEIVSMEYHITEITRIKFTPAYIKVVCKNRTVRLESAPLYTLSVAKKFNGNIKTKQDGIIWLIIAGMIILPMIIADAN